MSLGDERHDVYCTSRVHRWPKLDEISHDCNTPVDGTTVDV